MTKTWHASEEQALAQLHERMLNGGRGGAALQPEVRRRLEIERLVQADEFGQDTITERGVERLMRLRRIYGRSAAR